MKEKGDEKICCESFGGCGVVGLTVSVFVAFSPRLNIRSFFRGGQKVWMFPDLFSFLEICYTERLLWPTKLLSGEPGLII